MFFARFKTRSPMHAAIVSDPHHDADPWTTTIVVDLHHVVTVLAAMAVSALRVVVLRQMTITVVTMAADRRHETTHYHPDATKEIHMAHVDHRHLRPESTPTLMPEVILTLGLGVHHDTVMLVATVATKIDDTRMVFQSFHHRARKHITRTNHEVTYTG
jgi:hypothetical protein